MFEATALPTVLQPLLLYTKFAAEWSRSSSAILRLLGSIPKHNIYAFSIEIRMRWENDENKKRGWDWPIFKKHYISVSSIFFVRI